MNEREAALVVSAKGGDSRAFEDLYNHYYGKIFALARMTVKNDADAEDILQQAFINAWRNLHTLTNPAGFNTWLQKITLNLCYSLLRKKNIAILLDAENDIEHYGEEESDDDVLPAIYAERDDLRSRLSKIIDGLSEVQKQTILLYYFNEQKVEEIAYIMECNVSTVKTRLFLARKAIRSEVEEEERKSGEKFYGIPLLPFGDLLVQHFQSEILSAEVSSSVLAAVTEALTQGMTSGMQATSGGVQATSSGVQTTSIATGSVKGSVISSLPLSIKVFAIGCLA
ncbi:MAG: RNA polymerase sigma factor [Oscillospiraceae bacterium]|nr:RNA polymerase sigma factor [Oscillospiraceae bacterium]